ncbi:MAG: GNAT family N-acetyltransferase [Acetobacteraceae bacterium]
MMRCIVLYQGVAANAGPDEQDTLAGADSVAAALAANGFAVERIALGLDLGPLAARIAADPPDLFFNLVESLPGVRFPGPAGLAATAILEGSGVAFTGSRLAALALSSDKPAAKRVLRRAGVPVPPGPEEGWPGPFIVKHASEHASFGLGPDSVRRELPEGLPEGCFAEAFLPGREFNLSLLEEPEGLRVLPPAELVYAADWPEGLPLILDYAGKWLAHDPRFAATRRRFDGIGPELSDRLSRLARRAFEVLGISGYGRVDIRLDAAGVARVLEVNANPALAPGAGFAAAAGEGGISYAALIGRIASCSLSLRPSSPLLPLISPLPVGEGPGVRETSSPRPVGEGSGVREVKDIRLSTRLVPADAAAIGRLVAESGFFTAAERQIADELVHEALARGNASGYRFVLAEQPDGPLLGYACFGPVPASESAWDLYWIVVQKRAQGAGTGRRLVEHVAERVAAEGGRCLYAETSGRALYAPTRRFYAVAGFFLHAVLADFYAPGDAKQIWMRSIGGRVTREAAAERLAVQP